MMTSALLVVSAWIIAPPAENAVVGPPALVTRGLVACTDPGKPDAALAGIAATIGSVAVGPPATPPCGRSPPYRPRSVSATCAASAFLRYTMNTLPPTREGVS